MSDVDKPLAIDLFCGLFGWSAGLIAEGWSVVGIDLEDMHENFGMDRPREYGLIIQDVLTVDGRAFSEADLIVASPPCQFFSYTAMPWSRAKALAAAVRADPARLEKELALFNACFRIQREACEAAARHIPMVVENVKGAQPWVGRARWSFGSFYLWGDVPALMPIALGRQVMKRGVTHRSSPSPTTRQAVPPGGLAQGYLDGRKLPGFRFDGSGRSFQSASVAEGIKCGGDWFGDDNPSVMRHHSSKSPARKMASAMIAKIPLVLSRHIAATFLPRSDDFMGTKNRIGRS